MTMSGAMGVKSMLDRLAACIGGLLVAVAVGYIAGLLDGQAAAAFGGLLVVIGVGYVANLLQGPAAGDAGG